MKSENNISIPVILYGILLVVAVRFFSLSFERIFGVSGILILDNLTDPYSRLIFLFFEIIFIARFFKRIWKTDILTRRMLFNMMIWSILGALLWLFLYLFNIEYSPMFCGSSTREELASMYDELSSNKRIVTIIEIAVISISILIYTIFRISEMPKEDLKSEEG